MATQDFSQYDMSDYANDPTGSPDINGGQTRFFSPNQAETVVYGQTKTDEQDSYIKGGTQTVTRPDKKDEGGTTVIYLPPTAKMDPAVGWLVCIEGPDQGKSFRLVRGNNSMGRNGTQTYQVNLSDQSISRKKAVGVIVYDQRKNLFYLNVGSVDSGSNMYLNDSIVLSPKPLQARDQIEIERDKLVFMPFCCDKFVWNFDEQDSPSPAAPAGIPEPAQPKPVKEQKTVVNNPSGQTMMF